MQQENEKKSYRSISQCGMRSYSVLQVEGEGVEEDQNAWYNTRRKEEEEVGRNNGLESQERGSRAGVAR